jgi:hypothetical protein
LKEGDEVLTPAFDCDGALQPFVVMGCRLRFYRSDVCTFAVDVDDLKKRISTRTKLIHVVQHFGIPQVWDKLQDIINEMGIPILEDNAYSLFSVYKEQPFGSMGDLAVFSLRKELPLSDGGMLCINKPEYQWDPPFRRIRWIYPTERRSAIAIIQKKLREWIHPPLSVDRLVKMMRSTRNLHYPPPLYSDLNAPPPVWSQRDVIGNEFSCDYLRPMSRLARWQLRCWNAENFASIGECRRSAYSYLVAHLQDVPGLKVMNPVLPDGVVPYCLNLSIARHRDEVLSDLQKNYSVMAWPTLPGAVLEQIKDFPDVQELGRQLLQLVFPRDIVWPADYQAYLDTFVRDVKDLCNQYYGRTQVAVEGF